MQMGRASLYTMFACFAFDRGEKVVCPCRCIHYCLLIETLPNRIIGLFCPKLTLVTYQFLPRNSAGDSDSESESTSDEGHRSAAAIPQNARSRQAGFGPASKQRSGSNRKPPVPPTVSTPTGSVGKGSSLGGTPSGTARAIPVAMPTVPANLPVVPRQPPPPSAPSDPRVSPPEQLERGKRGRTVVPEEGMPRPQCALLV